MKIPNIFPLLSLLIFGVITVASVFIIRSQAFDASTSIQVTNYPPSLDTVKLCAGTGDPVGCVHVSNVVLTGGTTTTYSIAGTITDLNGMDDINNVAVKYYRVGNNCAGGVDENDCYIENTSITCPLISISSTQGAFDCGIELAYFTDATDDSSLASEGAYPSDNWAIEVSAVDMAGEVSVVYETSPNEVLSLRDLSACASINYGTLANGAASSTGVACAITNDGNVDIDIEISGLSMDCDVGSIPITNQRVDIVSASYASMGLTGTFANYSSSATTYSDIILNKRITSVETDDLYHTITVPFSVSGSCSGTNTISAVAEV